MSALEPKFPPKTKPPRFFPPVPTACIQVGRPPAPPQFRATRARLRRKRPRPRRRPRRASRFMDTLADLPGGAHQSVPVVALDSPSAAHHRRSSTFFPLRADTSPTDAAAAPTVAGAAAAAQLEREIYMDELATFYFPIFPISHQSATLVHISPFSFWKAVD